MPGSRKSEIKKHWGVFLDTIKQLKKDNKHEIQPVLIQAPNIAIENVPDNIIRIATNIDIIIEINLYLIIISIKLKL